MGYNVYLRGGELRIPAALIPAALAALEKPADEVLTLDEKRGRLKEIIGDCFKLGGPDEQDDLVIDTFYGNHKPADDGLFKLLAPFVQEGSHLDWQGEEGEYYQHLFKDGRVQLRWGEVVYPRGIYL